MKNSNNVYVTCPFCMKNYKGLSPKGGDGTGLLIPKHYTIIPVSNNLGLTILPGKKVVCPGSYHLIEI